MKEEIIRIIRSLGCKRDIKTMRIIYSFLKGILDNY